MKGQPASTPFNVFNRAVVESVFLFSIICWFGNLDQKEKNTLDKIVHIASKDVVVQFRSLDVVYKKHA